MIWENDGCGTVKCICTRCHIMQVSIYILGFPGGSGIINPPVQEMLVPSPSREDPLEKKTATPSVFLLGESHGETRWAAVHGVAKHRRT